jgi:hypothetical protein
VTGLTSTSRRYWSVLVRQWCASQGGVPLLGLGACSGAGARTCCLRQLAVTEWSGRPLKYRQLLS